MKLDNLRTGMLFEKKTSKKQSDNLYEVADIIQDEINGYKRVAITLGNIKTRTTEPVSISDLNNPKNWDYLDGAQISEHTEIVRSIHLRNGKDFIISRETIEIENKEFLAINPLSKSKPKQKKKDKETITPVGKAKIIKGVIESSPDIKRYAQHKQAETNSSNQMLNALANAKDKKPILKETIDPAIEEELEKDMVIYDKTFYWSLMSYTYDDLEILGEMTAYCAPLKEYITSEPKGASRIVHEQELDAFRNDGKSLRQIRAMGNRIKAIKPEQEGTPVSAQQILRRILKAFYHWGYKEEKIKLKLI